MKRLILAAAAIAALVLGFLPEQVAHAHALLASHLPHGVADAIASIGGGALMSAAAVDLTNLASSTLKIHYDDKTVESMAFGTDALMATMLKDPDAKLEGPGKTFNFPALAQNAGGVSNDFATSQTKSTTMGLIGKQFAVPLTRTYSTWTVDALALESGQEPDGAFVDTLKLLVDGGMEGVGGSLSCQAFRDGWGHVGQIAVGGITNATITLQAPESEIFFLVGMDYFFAASPTADARNAGGTLTCLSVNDGTVTFTANVSTLNAVVAGDFIFPLGNRALTGAVAAGQKAIAGFDAWVDGGTAFMGVDTSQHFLFQGVSLDLSATGGNVLDGLIQLNTKLGRRNGNAGGKIDRVVMNDSRFGDLVSKLQTEKRFIPGEVKSATGAIGFDTIKLYLPSGTVDVMRAPACPVDSVYSMNSRRVQLISAGSAPRYTDRDGKMILRQGNSDGYEGRCFAYANLIVRNVGQSIGRLRLPPRQ